MEVAGLWHSFEEGAQRGNIKKAVTISVTAYCGGEGGIRTHGPLRSHWFSRPAP